MKISRAMRSANREEELQEGLAVLTGYLHGHLSVSDKLETRKGEIKPVGWMLISILVIQLNQKNKKNG